MHTVVLHNINEQTNTHKEYRVTMDERADGWHVSGHNGRIGSALKEQVKAAGVSQEKAQQVFDDLVKSKVKGGYRMVDTEGAAIATPGAREIISDLIPMRPTPFDGDVSSIRAADWLVQEKHDGENRPILLGKREIVLTNRQGMPVATPQAILDDLITIRDTLGTMVLDAEDLGAKGLVIFDIRSGLGVDEHTPFGARNARLAAIADDVRALADSGLIRVDVAEPADVFFANGGVEGAMAAGHEGYVLKRADGLYSPGRTENVAKAATLKVKFTEDATFRVAPGRDPKKRSVCIQSWDPSTGAWSDRGHVTIPANAAIPAPGALIDVEYLYVTGAQGAPFQPVFKRERPDAVEADCDVGRLKLKGGGRVADLLSANA